MTRNLQRLVPGSLSVRLTLVMLVVLSLAQIGSAWIHYRERGHLLYYATGLNAAERVAGIVRLLDSLAPRERHRVMEALSVPPLAIRLLDEPASLPRQGSHGAQVEFLHRFLHRYLGEARPIRVWAGPEAQWAPSRPAPRHRASMPQDMLEMHRAMHGALEEPIAHGPVPMVSFIVETQLDDGQWVLVESLLPQSLFAWPYRLLASLAVLAASVFLVTVVVVRWLTRPLQQLAHAADELGRDMRRAPLPERGPLEVQRAARAFNRMQARILRFLEDRFRILAAVSHDLKTPVTRLRLRAEMLEDARLREKICRDLDEMNQMLQGALDFIRGIETREPTQEVDLNALLESLQDDARESGMSMTMEVPPGVRVAARPLALKRCLSNLLTNAFIYGGGAEVRVEDRGDELHIVVADRGPGIPEQELEHVFEPFYRLEGSRSRQTGGTGLGLSIARNIARAHGGELTLRNRPGGGLEAVLVLPPA